MLFCQPLQLRHAGTVPVDGGAAVDVSAANRWHWRPDYEGIELGLCRCDASLIAICLSDRPSRLMVRTTRNASSIKAEARRMPVSSRSSSADSVCREDWTALGPVVEAFAFDFANWRTNMAPAEMPLQLPIGHGGIWNAVAFWFELELDEETSLSTSPYADKACSTPRMTVDRDVNDMGCCASDIWRPLSKNMRRQCACWAPLGVRSDRETCVWRWVQGPTWQQAVQWGSEHRVSRGAELAVLCRHDTSGISFVVDDHEAIDLCAEGSHAATSAADLAAASGADEAASISNAAAGSQGATSASTLPASDAATAGGAAVEGRIFPAQRSRTARAALPADAGVPLKVIKVCRPTVAAEAIQDVPAHIAWRHTAFLLHLPSAVPLLQAKRMRLNAQDPVWAAAYEQLSALNAQLAKACLQNPLEYRATASSAVAFASRPHDLGVDVEQATDFCTKMLG